MESSQTIPIKRQSIAPLLLVVFIDMLGLGIVIPILAPLFLTGDHQIFSPATPFGVKTVLLGLIIAAFPLAQFFGAPILGALSDRVGRRKILILSIAGTVIGYACAGVGVLIGSIPLLFFSRLLDGFTGGNMSIALSAIADRSTPETKAHNFGLVHAAFGLGLIAGPYIGGVLSESSYGGLFGYATPLWCAAILAFINLILILFYFRETLVLRVLTKIDAFAGVKNILRAFHIQHAHAAFAVVFLLCMGINFFTQFFQVFLIKRFDFSQAQIGNFFAYAGLWIVLAQAFFVKPISKRFSPRQVLRVAPLVLAVSLLLPLFAHQHYTLFIMIPIIAIAQGLVHPNTTAFISNMADDDSQGEILGITQSFQSLAQILPPVIAGIVTVIHVHLPIILASVVTFFAWGVFFFIIKERTNRDQHTPNEFTSDYNEGI